MGQSYFPGRDKARHALLSLPMDPGQCVPPIDVAARQAGVSRVTMNRAITELCHAGELVKKGRRFYRSVRSAQPLQRTDRCVPVPPIAPQSPKWDKVREQILRDVTFGTFPAGAPLPSAKALCHKYGCSYPTARKALDSLVKDGSLWGDAQGLKTFSVKRARHSARIRIVGAIRLDQAQWQNSLLRDETHQLLESEAVSCGLGIEYLLASEADGRLTWRGDDGVPRDEIVDSKDTFGYLFSLAFRPDDVSANRRTIEALLRLRKPVAVLDHRGDWELPAGLRGDAPRVFSLSSSEAAVQVGRYLQGLGHRTVAFFSHVHYLHWSRVRLAGLQSVFANQSNAGRVLEFVFPGTPDKPSVANHPLVRRLLAFREGLGDEVPTLVSDVMFQQIDSWLWDFLRVRELEAHYRVALKHPEATAWVAVNDSVATYLLALLKRDGIRVPHDISIVSFDNSPSAQRNGLTSFSFDRRGLMHAIVAYLCGNPSAKKYLQFPRVQVGGILIERQSVSRVGS